MATTAKKIVRDYYTVQVPGDFTDNMEEVLDQAITEARERAKLWCVPAEWSAVVVSGELGDFEITVRVCRKRYKS